MKKAYIVRKGHKPVGLYSNLKALWNSIEDKTGLPHYATASSHLRHGFPVDIGSRTIDGIRIENASIVKLDANKISRREMQ